MEEGCGCVAMATGRDQHRPLPSLSNSSEMRSPAGPSSLPQCDVASGPWTGLACSWSFMWDVLAQTQQWTDSCLSSRDLLSSWLWIFPLASRYSGLSWETWALVTCMPLSLSIHCFLSQCLIPTSLRSSGEGLAVRRGSGCRWNKGLGALPQVIVGP